ncbi:hypothetical protein Tco_0509999, partial [Tanacetum coccineum]
TLGISPDVAELKDMVKALLLDKKNQTQAPAPVKAVDESCVTCGGTHSYRNFPATDVAELKDMVKALLLDKKNQTQAPAPVKAVEESCVM